MGPHAVLKVVGDHDMPLERSKQTIEPNSEVPRIGVPRFLELLELLRRHVRRQGRMTHVRLQRLSLLVRLRPSGRATACAMALAAARNGRATAASAAPTPHAQRSRCSAAQRCTTEESS